MVQVVVQPKIIILDLQLHCLTWVSGVAMLLVTGLP